MISSGWKSAGSVVGVGPGFMAEAWEGRSRSLAAPAHAPQSACDEPALQGANVRYASPATALRELNAPFTGIYAAGRPRGSAPPVDDDPLAHPRPRLTDGNAVADAALMTRLACGDPQALDPLYRRHRSIVYRFALLWS